jgi:hypothetical protein
LKDPIALFAAPWLCQSFDVDCVMLVRHPAAFVLSCIKDKKYVLDMRSTFVSQATLFQLFSCETKDIVLACVDHQNKNGVASDVVYEAAVAWRCFYEFAKTYIPIFPNWVVLIYEELVDDPIYKFERVFQNFGIAYSENCKSYVRTTSMVDAKSQKVTGHIKHYNAQEQAKAWQQKITTDAQKRIFQIVEPVFYSFYKTW